MPARSGNEPFKSYSFVVEIDGITQASFLECTGLESKTDVIEYREGTDSNTVRKLPGLTRFSNIVLKSGVTASKELYDWRRKVVEGQTERKDGAIILRDDRGNEVARWTFRDGWPCRMSGPDLNAAASGVAIEELEICHEGFGRVS